MGARIPSGVRAGSPAAGTGQSDPLALTNVTGYAQSESVSPESAAVFATSIPPPTRL